MIVLCSTARCNDRSKGQRARAVVGHRIRRFDGLSLGLLAKRQPRTGEWDNVLWRGHDLFTSTVG